MTAEDTNINKARQVSRFVIVLTMFRVSASCMSKLNA